MEVRSQTEMISIIQRMILGNQIKKYIDFIRFPFYRNLEIDSFINFNFPLTVFIGQNGCGKSSSLHALYGAPENFTPYNFWFDTKVDPIEYYSDNKKRHSFWYKYKDENGIDREVIKARIRRNDNPNYWETSRPLKWAGMQTREKNDRDSPIKKHVLYLDFRSELSAFDKFFYFADISNSTFRNKQEFIRSKSVKLKKLFTQEESFILNAKGSKLNEELKSHENEIIEYISYILGKDYVDIKSIYHKLFFLGGYSVLFKTKLGAQYSEAFAGSGEMAVFRLVTEILNAPNYSLILLDEPEVSLHPGAQDRLRNFLLDQIIKKKHQIVLTTHSPVIANGMPKQAIKVFYKNPNNGRFLIKENITAEEAFYFIEFPLTKRKNIIVEDILAKSIIEGLLKDKGEETRNLFNIKYNPGGAEVIIKDFITVFCRDDYSNNFILFDGDQQICLDHFNWRDLPSSELTVNNLIKKIKEQTDVEIKFSVDGNSTGSNQVQQLELLKKYADYYLKSVFYLPKKIPEEIIWNTDFAHMQIRSIILDENQSSQKIANLDTKLHFKEKFSYIAFVVMGDDSSEYVLNIQKLFIQRWLNEKNEDYIAINSIIEQIKNV